MSRYRSEASSATVDTMTMTQRGELSAEDLDRLLHAKAADQEADAARLRYRSVCVEMVSKSSLRNVAHLTGLSTNTLQRWKREAE